MGGSAATHDNFWQLFVRPAGSTAWRLVTPPGVADNGGLVVAGTGGQSLITAFRPSQYLTFTPLTVTRDGGRAWSPAGPLSGGLANVPDALAAEPGTGQLLALLTSGTVEVAAPGYARWHRLASGHLASTPAGPRCGLRAVTAVTSTRRAATGRRQLRPPRRRGYLCRPERDLAGSGSRAGRGPRPRAGHRAEAGPDGQGHRRAAPGGQRARPQPVRRLVW